MAVYDEPFWRADGFSGQVTSTDGPVKVVFDNTPPTGNPGVLLGFLEGEQARKLGRLPLAERRDAVIACFARFFGAAPRSPNDYIERVMGRGAVHARLLRRLLPARRAGPRWAPALREPCGRSTGPAPRPPRSGTATWTARSAPANAPRTK